MTLMKNTEPELKTPSQGSAFITGLLSYVLLLVLLLALYTLCSCLQRASVSKGGVASAPVPVLPIVWW